ncbi:hypothetical protein IKG05_01950 [Candidatus Saccharibacteria bacterium]|nr:hypothetical protein [Candidatus Saccharibacteria bacterium]
MDEKLSKNGRVTIGLAIVAVIILWAWSLSTREVVPIIMSSVIGMLLIGIAVSILRDDREADKQGEVMRYLLEDVTKTMYLNGLSVDEWLCRGIVWELSWHEVGDFARPLGCLILDALYEAGDETARLYWQKREDINGQEYYNTYIVFKYDGWDWQLNLRCRWLNEGLRRFRRKTVAGYTVCYLDIPPEERSNIERYKDPHQSELAPDFWYENWDLASGEKAVNSLIARTIKQEI